MEFRAENPSRRFIMGDRILFVVKPVKFWVYSSFEIITVFEPEQIWMLR